jgi:hypothetical protein
LVVLDAAGILLLGSGASHGQSWDACSARVQKDQQDMARAIDRYGYNSRQAQHKQAELQRDAARCGYDQYGNQGYRDGDDRRYRYPNGGYERGYDRGYGNYSPAFDNGYRDGFAMGQRDSERNKAFRPSKNDWYEDADRGYNRNYGDKNFYKREYRQGFQQGYSEGYQRWR